MTRVLRISISSPLHITWKEIEAQIRRIAEYRGLTVDMETEYVMDGKATIQFGNIEIERSNYSLINLCGSTLKELFQTAAVVETALAQFGYLNHDSVRIKHTYGSTKVLDYVQTYYGTLTEYLQLIAKPRNYTPDSIYVENLNFDELFENLFDEQDIIGLHEDRHPEEADADHDDGNVEIMHHEDYKAEREYRDWCEDERAAEAADSK